MTPTPTDPRSRPGGSSPRVFPAVTDTKMRIFVLLIFLAMVAALGFLLKSFAKHEKRKESDGGGIVALPAVAQKPVFEGVPTLDPTLAKTVRDQTDAQRNRWPDAAASYLLREVRTVPAVKAHDKNLLPLTPSLIQELLKTDKREVWRFKFFRIKGTLQYLERVEYEQAFQTNATDIGQVYHGRLKVEGKGGPYYVTFVLPFDSGSTVDPKTVPVEGKPATGVGIFVKLYGDLGPDGTVTPSLLFVANRMQRDFKVKEVNSLEDVGFDELVDDPSLAGGPREGELYTFKMAPLLRLVQYAEKHGGKKGEPKPVSIDTPGLYKDLMKHGSAHRGQYLSGQGIIASNVWINTSGAIPPNDAGIDEDMEGMIFTDGYSRVLFVAPKSLERDWKRNDRISFEGYFFKSKAYHSKAGPQFAPMVVLTRLDPLAVPQPDYTGEFIFAGIFVLAIGLFIFLVTREDKDKADYRELRRRSRRAAAANLRRP